MCIGLVKLLKTSSLRWFVFDETEMDAGWRAMSFGQCLFTMNIYSCIGGISSVKIFIPKLFCTVNMIVRIFTSNCGF